MSLRCLRFLTAGESHGPQLTGILDGLPAGVPIDLRQVNKELSRRMAGYGRGKRMKIEHDKVRVVAGIRQGSTLGSPIAYGIDNLDWSNWQQVMAIEGPPVSSDASGVAESGNLSSPKADPRRITRPRPGHADLAGGLKYRRDDLRDVLERASARETAARVAGGAFCKQLLAQLGIGIASHVVRIGSSHLEPDSPIPLADIIETADDSPVRCVVKSVEAEMIAAIDAAHDQLDTLGGSFEVVAAGVPAGLGSHVQWDRKLDGRLAQAMISIPAQKGVEIGQAFWGAAHAGSEVHDPIAYDSKAKQFERSSNRAGGLEGGITNGSEVRVVVHMKPLSTLRQPLPSIDMETGEPVAAVVQRSDVCAVPAAAVVGEAMLAIVLADACLEKFGGDSLEETRRNWSGYLQQMASAVGSHAS